MCLNLSWPHSFSKTVWVLCIFILHALWSQCAQLQNWRLEHSNYISKNWKNIVIFCTFLQKEKDTRSFNKIEIFKLCINAGIKYVQLKAPAEWANTVNAFYIWLFLFYWLTEMEWHVIHHSILHYVQVLEISDTTRSIVIIYF